MRFTMVPGGPNLGVAWNDNATAFDRAAHRHAAQPNLDNCDKPALDHQIHLSNATTMISGRSTHAAITNVSGRNRNSRAASSISSRSDNISSRNATTRGRRAGR